MGVVFDSSTGFVLPSGAIRSPDAAWVRADRYRALAMEDREGYVPLCPDAIVEIRSRPDRIADLRSKMAEWMDSGALLGILIDPFEQRVDVHREGGRVETLEAPAFVDGDPVLPGFRLGLADVW